MRITYDREADAVYISFAQVPVTTKGPDGGVALDYDAEGRLAGIEILNVSARLSDADTALKQVTLESVARPRTPPRA